MLLLRGLVPLVELVDVLLEEVLGIQHELILSTQALQKSQLCQESALLKDCLLTFGVDFYFFAVPHVEFVLVLLRACGGARLIVELPHGVPLALLVRISLLRQRMVHLEARYIIVDCQVFGSLELDHLITSVVIHVVFLLF